MCVIVVSERGTRQPTKATLETCFRNNPDGAGYMVARAGRVEIHKGFMTFEDFWRNVHAERFTAADPVVYHFRISTQAGVNPEMTHPFPLSRKPTDLRALDLNCPIGVAHNGIIPATVDKDSSYSDTAIYIARYLTRLIRKPSDLDDPYIADLIEFTTGSSRMAIMDGDGAIVHTGPGWTRDERDILYSNRSFENRTYVRPAVGYTYARN